MFALALCAGGGAPGGGDAGTASLLLLSSHRHCMRLMAVVHACLFCVGLYAGGAPGGGDAGGAPGGGAPPGGGDAGGAPGGTFALSLAPSLSPFSIDL